MTNAQINKKLDKISDILLDFKDDLTIELTDIEEKIQAIQDKADDNDRELTSKEEERIQKLEERMESIQSIIDDLCDGIDPNDYCL